MPEPVIVVPYDPDWPRRFDQEGVVLGVFAGIEAAIGMSAAQRFQALGAKPVIDSDFWVRHLAFRDYLRAHPESAAVYYELKRDLAVRFSKEEYTEAKSPFIERILVSALGHHGQRTAQQRVAPDGR